MFPNEVVYAAYLERARWGDSSDETGRRKVLLWRLEPDERKLSSPVWNAFSALPH
jgi:hypothetical protein